MIRVVIMVAEVEQLGTVQPLCVTRGSCIRAFLGNKPSFFGYETCIPISHQLQLPHGFLLCPSYKLAAANDGMREAYQASLAAQKK